MQGEGERIPVLLEVISVTKGKVGLNIELKAKGLQRRCAKCWIR